MLKLSIIVPVFNEKDTIAGIIEKVEATRLQGVEKEIIIIDDCSSDGTREKLDCFGKKYKIILKEENEGKGSAIKIGFKEATGEMLIIQDADLEYDPDDYGAMLEPILSGQADVVYGSRFVGSRPHRVMYFWHYLGNRFLTGLSNMLSNLNLTDMETGYKAFNRKAIDSMKDKISSRRFGIEPELTALAAKNRLRIYEIGISYYGRNYAEGKKIRWVDGLAAIWHIIKFNILK